MEVCRFLFDPKRVGGGGGEGWRGGGGGGKVRRWRYSSTRWRVEFQENLARKDAEEKTKMEELKAKAKKELEDW